MATRKWRELCVSPAASIRDALRIIDTAGLQVALVVEDERLLGILTDGDVRRALLAGRGLEDPVSVAVNRNPRTLPVDATREKALAFLRHHRIRHVPQVDAEGRLTGMVTLDDLALPPERPNAVVIMAGGEGTRLYPLTRSVPKPLLPVGNRPILEIIIDELARQGFRRFFLAVNYKAEMIEAHFGDGASFGVEIRYLREQQKLGTAGALALLPGKELHPVLVMNGDLLTRMDFGRLMEFHAEQRAAATMVLARHEMQCPYGVVATDGNHITAFEEKPRQVYQVNGGIYVLQPDVVDLVAPGKATDMPDLFGRLMQAGSTCAGYRVADYWLDIGRMDDLERARGDYR